MNLIVALGQAVDFLFKAVKAYADTDEGRKEFSEVIQALEASDSPMESQPVDQETKTRSYRG